MNRPQVKNAIGKNFLSQLESSIASLKHSDARVVVLRSAVEKTFCAGADLKVCKATTLETHEADGRFLPPLFLVPFWRFVLLSTTLGFQKQFSFVFYTA